MTDSEPVIGVIKLKTTPAQASGLLEEINAIFLVERQSLPGSHLGEISLRHANRATARTHSYEIGNDRVRTVCPARRAPPSDRDLGRRRSGFYQLRKVLVQIMQLGQIVHDDVRIVHIV
jgi:hypothetical protein